MNIYYEIRHFRGSMRYVHQQKGGCMAIRTQTELMTNDTSGKIYKKNKICCNSGSIRWNTGEYHSECGNSGFNNRENDNANYMFRSYNNCYYTSFEPVLDEKDGS